MAITYVRHTTGANLYFKPSPLATSPWSSGVVAGTETGTTGEYAFDVSDNAQGTVFLRSGGSPASSDSALAQVYALVAPNNTGISTLLDRVPGTVRTAVQDADADAAIVELIGSSNTEVGIRQIKVIFKREDESVVNNVRVDILELSRVKYSNTFGIVTSNVDPETYTLRVTPPLGYESVEDVEITVGEEDVEEEITLTSTPMLNVEPNETELRGTIVTLEDTPVLNASVEIKATSIDSVQGKVFATKRISFVSETGTFAVGLPKNGSYTIRINNGTEQSFRTYSDDVTYIKPQIK